MASRRWRSRDAAGVAGCRRFASGRWHASVCAAVLILDLSSWWLVWVGVSCADDVML